ncbi:MAG: indole-3-glycerol phosphate synthase TrpC [Prevotellaceae bacterium]|jgi:indole-3-glycerol phosphate synthase|nr:indole-3-glycerol phosphate synthase TrpC [Prevotellaceae bacterium]
MMNILDRILLTKRIEVDRKKNEIRTFEEIFEQAKAVTRPTLSFVEALEKSDNHIIAEFKRRSPSKGFFNARANVETIVGGYSAAGAAAISVLTDHDYFAGSLDDLSAARKVSTTPLLRKDFIIDPYQICEARIAGADVVLLIATIMSPDRCAELAEFARSLGLEVLLEIHNEYELVFLNPFVNAIGVNNRDLTTFATDVSVSHKLAPMIPKNFLKISESGISSPATVKELYDAGFRGFLMGENFMKYPEPDEALKRFIEKTRFV